jgi:hypothetical protein
MKTGDRFENDVAFFSEELCARADDTLRMAFLLTLDRKSAHLCVRDTYHVLAENIATIPKDGNITPLLVKRCWEAFGKIKKNPPGKNYLAELLAKLSIEVRASIGAVDFMGLDVKEASEALGMEVSDMRSYLAVGREALLKSSLAALS